MLVLLAVLPPLLAMGVFLLGQSATRAAILGAGSAAIIALLAFPLSGAEWVEAGVGWSPLLLEVLLIVLGGIAFAEFTRVSGAQDRIATWLRGSLGTGVAGTLAIIHGVTPLAESLTGFGIGVIIALPLLLSLGLDGRRASIIALLGMCAVPWGSMAPGVLIASELAGLPFRELGVATGVVNLPVTMAAGVMGALIIARRRRWAAAAAGAGSGVFLGLAILGANLLIGTAPAGAVGTALTLLLHLGIRRLRGADLRMDRPTARALIPHGVLLGGALASNAAIVALGVDGTQWRLLGSPALWLAVASIVAIRGCRWGEPVRKVWRTWLPVGPATGLFVLLGVIMAISGMARTMAGALVALGQGYIPLSTVVAGMGGFVTGSTTGANAMFAGPQFEASELLGVSALAFMAAHNAAASIFAMSAPARVELVAGLCPDKPDPRAVQRPLLLFNLGAVIVMGLGLLAAAPLLAV